MTRSVKKLSTRERLYRARVYRTNVLLPHIREELQTVILALAGRKTVSVIHQKGIGADFHGGTTRAHHHYMATCEQWCATGATEEGALAALLAVLLNGAFYPKT